MTRITFKAGKWCELLLLSYIQFVTCSSADMLTSIHIRKIAGSYWLLLHCCNDVMKNSRNSSFFSARWIPEIITTYPEIYMSLLWNKLLYFLMMQQLKHMSSSERLINCIFKILCSLKCVRRLFLYSFQVMHDKYQITNNAIK